MPTIQHHSFRRPNSVRSLIQQFHLPKTSDASSRSVAVHGPQIGIPSQERVGGPAIDHTVAGPATAGWCAFLRKGGLGAPLSDWASFGRRRSVLRVGRGPATGATRVAPVAGPLGLFRSPPFRLACWSRAGDRRDSSCTSRGPVVRLGLSIVAFRPARWARAGDGRDPSCTRRRPSGTRNVRQLANLPGSRSRTV